MKAGKLVYGVGINDVDYVTRKIETIEVNGIEIPEISFIPENGQSHIVPAVNINFCQNRVANLESEQTAFFIKHGLCYPNTEEGERVAVAHSKALMGVVV